ncbi:MAG: serine hydrolase domain-containing protein [Blastocatellia bacterium]|nr:serine hydrolase domain-containing protein [Blastocatellia bacterium]
MKKRLLSLTIALGFLLTAPAAILPAASAQIPVWRPGYRDLGEKLQARFKELRKENEFPGVNIGLAMADGQSISVSIGYSDLEALKPLKPADRMLSGSIGKTYVSAVTLQLVEERKLNLDDKIETWLGREPWFARLPNGREITLRMLMNHTSGITEHVTRREFTRRLVAEPDKVWKPEELVAYSLDLPPLFEAGKGWAYADTNYILVGMIFERVTGRTVYGEVERRLLKPFKLKETSPSDSRVLAGLIPGYSRLASVFGFEGRTLVDGRFVINPQMEWCGGGFVTTAEDLAKWAKVLYAGKVLRPFTRNWLFEAVPAKTGPGDQYGLGVMVRQTPWGVTYGHGGIFPGYLSEMQYFPDHKTAIAVQFNTDDMKTLKLRPRAYVEEVARIVFGEKKQP